VEAEVLQQRIKKVRSHEGLKVIYQVYFGSVASVSDEAN
jgi:uncharacterized protein with ACT and thioredoxin-like domain